MLICELELFYFRNYEKLTLSPSEGVNILVGRNAQGKTNVIEALFLCCSGRSFRGAKENELVQWERDFTLVKVKNIKADGRHALNIGIIKDGKKSIKADGKPLKRMGELMGRIPGVIFSPEHLRMIKDGPSERRRFLDIALSQTDSGYFYCLQQYNRALRQRNVLLKQNAAEAQLLPFEIQLAQIGAVITRTRMDYVEKLAPQAGNIYSEIARGETAGVQYQYQPGQEDEQAYAALFHKTRERDIKMGSTQYGPHKDDIHITVNGSDARIYASQGQQRTAVLSIKLAELQYMRDALHEQPVLLLDDVMSELDESRQKALIARMRDIQTFITCTRPDEVYRRLGHIKEYQVEAGKIREESGNRV